MQIYQLVCVLLVIHISQLVTVEMSLFVCFQIQSEIVSVFMTFTRPVVQSADHEEGKFTLFFLPSNINFSCFLKYPGRKKICFAPLHI